MRRIGLSLFFVLVFFGMSTLLGGKHISENEKFFLIEADGHIETGDIIFRTGTGFWSPYFAQLDERNGYSHAGMLLKSGRGSWFVVHAEANDDGTDGVVKKTPFNEFLQKAIVNLENFNDHNILDGMGELLTEKQKTWAKSKLKAETIFLFKLALEAEK